MQAPFKVDWQLTDADNAQKYTRVELTLTNRSGDTIYGRDWCILYYLLYLRRQRADIVFSLIQGCFCTAKGL